MSTVPVFQVSTLWAKSPPDGNTCTKCKEIIYGDKWELVIQFVETDIKDTTFTPIETRLCDPCYVRFVK